MFNDIRKRDKTNMVSIMWESVTEPAKAALLIKDEARRNRAVKFADGSAASGESPERWFGAPSFAVLQERLTKGWSEGVDRLMKIALRDFDTVSIRRRRIRSDQGDEVDMQAVWRGDMSRAWTRTRRQARAGGVRTVTIVCNLGGSASTSSEKLFWRGASALRLADALTTAGYNVAIIGGEVGSDTGDSKDIQLAQFIEIKAADQPLDLSALASITCMAGFFRTALFAGICVGADMVGDAASWGMGRECHDLAPHLEALGVANAIVQPRVNSEAEAVEWLEAALKQIEQPMAVAA
jgi:hypothetical protein